MDQREAARQFDLACIELYGYVSAWAESPTVRGHEEMARLRRVIATVDRAKAQWMAARQAAEVA